MGAYEITAMVVFKSLWWIVPLLGVIEAIVITEYYDER